MEECDPAQKVPQKVLQQLCENAYSETCERPVGRDTEREYRPKEESYKRLGTIGLCRLAMCTEGLVL